MLSGTIGANWQIIQELWAALMPGLSIGTRQASCPLPPESYEPQGGVRARWRGRD